MTTFRAGLLLCSLLVSWGCSAGSFYVEPEGGRPANLFQSSSVFEPESGMLQTVVRSPNDWETLLEDYPTADPAYARDRFYRVDYSRYMVVGIALGRRWSSSIRVRIDSLGQVGQVMVVYATEFRPAEQSSEIGNPAHFVVTQPTNLPVEFADVRVVVESID